MTFLRWLLRDGDDQHVSSAWLKAQEQEDNRVDYHGPRIYLPLNKRRDENGWRNRFELRNREVA